LQPVGGRKARELLERHGHLFNVKVSHKSAAANRWDIEGHDGGMSTAGVGGPITGKGAHLLIVDDPIKNDEQARSSSQRQKQWEWWQSVATTRLRPGALSMVIQTRWHRDDLTGRIMEQARQTGQRWRVVKFPAIAEETDALGRAPGEALWPDVYSQARLEEVKKNRTNYYWQAMYQQNPTSEGSAEWPIEFFDRSIWFEDWPTQWICKSVALDPSKGTESKFGDYSAFVKVMYANDHCYYVDADLAQRNCSIMIDTALEIQREFLPDWFGVEVNQFQQLLADDLWAKADSMRLPVPLWTINNTINKEVRIRRLTPWLSRKTMRFKANSRGAQLLVEQLRDFPLADHDDGPDALEMAMRLICEWPTELVIEDNQYLLP
jgi:predicted phage terminase large subunit-like protein